MHKAMTIRMIAARALRYAGRVVPAGAEFLVQGSTHARVLQAIGSARPAPPPAAEPPAPPAAARRAYKRRDMVAEQPALVLDELVAPQAAEEPAQPESAPADSQPPAAADPAPDTTA